MNLRRFYISPQMALTPQPEITGSDAGHICRVLRLTPGDVVELFDGKGNGYRATIASATPKRVRVTIENRFPLLAESSVHITLAQGILKDRKMDDLIRGLTELGIDCWKPFYASRSVPVPKSAALEKRLRRWEKIALEAVKQCRRGCVPTIAPADTFDDILASSTDCDLKLLFWEGASRAFNLPRQAPRSPQKIMVVVGPEGGFNPEEVQRAQAHEFFTTGLGPRILRAETATLSACALVQYRFGDMGATP
jgi:16S rRNA (uracil1498-N3)-methyltransferase